MSSPSPIRAGTIRRVVRRGQTFICGMCREQHGELAPAEQCVVTCWAAVLAMDPVIARRHGLRTSFRCRFCARDYRERHQAHICAHDCRHKFIARHDQEQDLTLHDDPGANRRRYQPKPKAVLQAAPRHPKAAAAAAAAPSTLSGAAPISVDTVQKPEKQAPPPAVAAPAPAPTVEAAPAAAKDAGSRWKDKEVFYRDGARYICRGCDTKYFTKEDVFACFEKHQPPA